MIAHLTVMPCICVDSTPGSSLDGHLEDAAHITQLAIRETALSLCLKDAHSTKHERQTTSAFAAPTCAFKSSQSAVIANSEVEGSAATACMHKSLNTSLSHPRPQQALARRQLPPPPDFNAAPRLVLSRYLITLA